MDFLQDLRQAFRQLRRTPGFTGAAVLTLALGIGANTAIFSVVNGVLLRPLPYPDAQEIVRVFQVGEAGGRSAFSDPNFTDLREQSRGFQELAQFSTNMTSVVAGNEPVRIPVSRVSGSFLEVMGVGPLLGRAFLPEELVEGAGSSALVSHAFWQRYLGGDPDLARLTLRVADASVPVVGVMPPDFDFPTGTALWLPRETLPTTPSRTAHNWNVLGRLAPGATLASAQADASALAGRLKSELGGDTWMSDVRLVPLPQEMVERVRPALLLLFGAAGVLLLIACANVANLLLARAESRKGELAVRMALGARPGRVMRHFLGETLVLAGVGGALGVLLAHWSVAALVRLQPGNLPRWEGIAIDGWTLLFTLGVSLLAAVVLGAGAAGRAIRDAGGALSGGRSHAGSRKGTRLRSGLVVSQMGLTLVLLVAAGLLGRSLLAVLEVDLGFQPENVLTLAVALPPPADESGRLRLASFHQSMIDGLETIPGVGRAGGVNALPLGGGGGNGLFLKLTHPEEVENFEDFQRLMTDPSRTGSAEYRVASPGYFEVLGIPLLEGRLFDGRDGPDAPHAAVVSRSLAEASWPGESPLGKLVQYGNMDGDLRPITVVGVVGDVREAGLEAEPRPTFYAFHAQRPGYTAAFTYVLSTGVSPMAVLTPAREVLRGVDAEIAPSFRTLEEVYAGALAERRFNLVLLGVFGGSALLLSLFGIYGVLSFAVVQRTREIGVRMALGAREAAVLRLVVLKALLLAGVGVAVGVLGAAVLTRVMESLLFGVGTMDPVTFVAAALLLLAAASVAAWLPARRAARVDPMVALRAE